MDRSDREIVFSKEVENRSVPIITKDLLENVEGLNLKEVKRMFPKSPRAKKPHKWTFLDSPVAATTEKMTRIFSSLGVDVRGVSAGVDLREILYDIVDEDAREEAFYVINLSTVVDKVKMWKSNMSRVQAHYAVKCNPDPVVIKLLYSLGWGFDCASKEEIRLVQHLTGCKPERIIFANPCKFPSHIRYACEKGVKRMTFDSIEEVKKIAKYFPDAELVLRIATDDSKSACQFSSKFGAVVSEYRKLLEVASEKQLKVVGVSFHVGSGCGDPEAYRKALENARAIFDIGEEFGFEMELVDIGGGFPGVDTSEISLPSIARVVNNALEDLFPESSGVHLIAEPGRYIATAPYTLACSVTSKKLAPLSNQSSLGMISEEEDRKRKRIYYLDDGIYQSFNCIYFDHVVADPVPLTEVGENDVLYPSKFFGPTCDSIDVIADNLLLPELEIGDWLVFRNMGAYTISSSSYFNGFTPKDTSNVYIYVE